MKETADSPTRGAGPESRGHSTLQEDSPSVTRAPLDRVPSSGARRFRLSWDLGVRRQGGLDRGDGGFFVRSVPEGLEKVT